MIIIRERQTGRELLRLWADTLAGADLRDQDLAGADLAGADLRTSDLRGADLRGADLRGATLEDADLRGANLVGARLQGARLIRALYDQRTRWPEPGFLDWWQAACRDKPVTPKVSFPPRPEKQP